MPAFKKVKMVDTAPLGPDEMEATVEKALEILEGSRRGGSLRGAFSGGSRRRRVPGAARGGTLSARRRRAQRVG